MKGLLRIKTVVAAITITILAGLVSTPAFAVPIVFNLGYGGTVSYDGGNNPFVTTNGQVASVTNGGTTLTITGGDLDFSTGNYTGGSATSTGFVNNYAAGGSINISGDIPGDSSGSVILMSGDFADVSTFNCCSNNILGSFNGLLNVSYIYGDLANALGFYIPPTGGAIAQLQIFLSSLPQGPGLSFTGTQGGGSINVSDTAKVTEPASLILIGVGLLGVKLLGRKWLKVK